MATQEFRPPFATVDDLASRWHALTTTEELQAEKLLDDASDIIMSLQPNWQQVPAATLKRICCQMVKRAMLADSANPNGLTQFAQTAGSYSESGTYANPSGDLYVTAVEKQALGIGKQVAFHVTLGAC